MDKILEDMRKDVQILTQLLEENKEMNDKFHERMIEGLKNIHE